MTLSEELQWRGFVNQTTYKDITELDGNTITFYWGVDPTASSMTIGNLAAAMMVRHFISHGHKAVLLVGGATGMIGDPDGKADERTLQTPESIKTNKEAIANQYKQIFDGQNFELVDNYDWFKDMGYLQFLREVGKHVPMRQMLSRDFVQTRLAQDGSGISYAEFSYALIQGYDFVHLNKEHGVTLQVCGSDQWGNSIAGVDLVRRLSGREAHVWSTPLIINKATGVKFGKSEDGAVWLDEKLTSAFKFYQFWLNLDDAGVEDYLKIYTLLSKPELEKIMIEFDNDRRNRLAQKKLAYEVTKLVHGQAKVDAVVNANDVLFGQNEFQSLKKEEIDVLRGELRTVKASADLYQLLVDAELSVSKSEARTFHASGAISINGKKISLDQEILLKPGANLVKRGKNSFALIEK
ncbi:tyrosine--tRNA ligase [Candidatus Saccharibacteria bacterium]|nr:tyrosine--tRNA ligase [Candidatus Saccharibacteria bacterium]